MPTYLNPFWTRWAGFDGFYSERVSDQGRHLPGYGLDNLTEGLDSPELSGLNAEFIRSRPKSPDSNQTRSHLMFALFGLLAAAMGLAFLLVYAKLLADKNLLIIYVGLFIAGFVGFRYYAPFAPARQTSGIIEYWQKHSESNTS